MRCCIIYLFLGFALCAGGCTFLTETNPEKPWSDARYRELVKEHEQRLAGEDRDQVTVGEAVMFAPGVAWSAVEWSWNSLTGHTPGRYARDLTHRNPDIRRKAIYVLSDRKFGRRPPYTDYYAHMAGDDIDQTVRAAALRALNRSRARQTSLYLAALKDPSEQVRLEAAKALANIPDPEAISPLMSLLADEQQPRDIRIAAADALRAYPRSDVAQALIRVLAGRDFGLARQARKSLNLMTGKDFRYDQQAWLTYLTSSDSPFPQC